MWRRKQARNEDANEHIWHISWYLWQLKTLLFEPSKSGSPLGQKMDEPSAYVPVAQAAFRTEDPIRMMEM